MASQKNAEHALAKSSVQRHASNQQILIVCEQCERVCYSSNSRAYDTQTIPESYVTLNPITQIHNRYMTVSTISPLALQIPVHNSIPLQYHYTTSMLLLPLRYYCTTIILPLTLYLGLKQLTPYRLS